MPILINPELKVRGTIESLIGGRSENQDAADFIFAPIGTAVVVCDGMGGMKGGSTASTLAVQSILNYILAADKDDSPKEVLEKAFAHANDVIVKTGTDNPELCGMGTTVVAAIITRQSITLAFIGDSRIYQLRGKKKVFRTFDHSMVYQQLVKTGVLTEEQARLSAQSNIIMRALGNGKPEPEIYELPYLEGDRFILCTDGFWGAMPEDDFLKLLTAKGDIKNIIRDVVRIVDMQGQMRGGTHDNLTVAAFDIKCNSKLRVKMSKKVKIILSAIIVLLMCSTVLNGLAVKKITKDKPIIKAVREYYDRGTDPASVKALCDSLEMYKPKSIPHHGK